MASVVSPLRGSEAQIETQNLKLKTHGLRSRIITLGDIKGASPWLVSSFYSTAPIAWSGHIGGFFTGVIMVEVYLEYRRLYPATVSV